MDATVPDSFFSLGRSLVPDLCAVYWLWKTLDKNGLVLIYKYSYLLPKQMCTINTINNLKGMTSALIIFLAWALNSSHKSHILVESTFETIMDVCIVGCYIFIGKPIWVTPSNYHTPATITEPKILSLSYPTQASMTQLGSFSEPLHLFRWEGGTSVTREKERWPGYHLS